MKSRNVKWKKKYKRFSSKSSPYNGRNAFGEVSVVENNARIFAAHLKKEEHSSQKMQYIAKRTEHYF